MKDCFFDLSRFINSARERRFNDSLMRLIVVEIKLKSFEFNDEMILPRYFDKSTFYNGENYKRSAIIKDLMPKKAVEQAKELVIKGSSINFNNNEELRDWIAKETNINDGSLASLF